MDEQKQQLIDRLKQGQNILVTVSANPSVDQLSAAIGLTVALNKYEKHGTAVFSGQVPSTLEFLKPEETLEKNTDSLRDFIIALDKSKADKLRYKVEDQVVRIFITPYRTSLSQADLDFSQGDFNVDVVICLGVTDPQDLDVAITAHGRILHDATVVSVSTEGQGSLGSINWVDPASSSLCEMVAGLVDGLDKKLLDNQIATALLTGIVATTDRFRNEKTSPKTMSASAQLMAAGANQQLIASELETPESSAPATKPAEDQTVGKPEPAAEKAKVDPGTLEIDHEASEETQPEAPEPPRPQVHVDENGQLITDELTPEISKVRGVATDGVPSETGNEVRRERLVAPPALGDADLTANTSPEALDPSTEELTLPPVDSPLLSHTETVLAPAPVVSSGNASGDGVVSQSTSMPTHNTFAAPSQIAADEPDDTATLTEIETAVDSPHLHADDTLSPPADSVDNARSAVEAAFSGAQVPSNPLEPIAALNAQPLGMDLHEPAVPATPPAPSFAVQPPAGPSVTNTGFSEPTPGTSPADEALDMPLPPNPFGPTQVPNPTFQASNPLNLVPPSMPSAFPGNPQQNTQNDGQTPPPPVPPPMLPPLG